MKKKIEQQIADILKRPHKPSECPAKGMFGRHCKNCREEKQREHTQKD